MKQKKFILQESEMPTQWYNIQADMPNKPMPPIHPGTKEPLGWEALAHIFPAECCKQELDTEHAWIDIPEEVLEKYKYYRATPLVRAYALEEALGTPAHIYFKNESVNPLGSHKINSALAQCYYAKQVHHIQHNLYLDHSIINRTIIQYQGYLFLEISVIFCRFFNSGLNPHAYIIFFHR